MTTFRRIAILVLCCFAVPAWRAAGQESHPLLGTWDLVPGQSTDIDHFGALTIDVTQSGPGIDDRGDLGAREDVPRFCH